MRTCPYCGKEWPDELEFCPIDQHALKDDKVHWASQEEPAVNGRVSRRRGIKFIVAVLAYVPMLVLLSIQPQKLPDAVETGCILFNLPAFSVLSLFPTQGKLLPPLIIIFAVLLLWSSFMAWVFWRIAGTFQGEDEPETSRGQYDWTAFRIRFAIGFVIGFLLGWRFVKNSQSMKTLTVASVVAGIIGGLIYGVSKPPDFWSRT